MKFFEWFKCDPSKNLVSRSVLQEKALEIATEIKVENFIASNGWLECFRKCHNTSFKTISGERCV